MCFHYSGWRSGSFRPVSVRDCPFYLPDYDHDHDHDYDHDYDYGHAHDHDYDYELDDDDNDSIKSQYSTLTCLLS